MNLMRTRPEQPRRRPTRRNLLAGALTATASGALLTACGSGEPAVTTSAAGSSTATASDAAETPATGAAGGGVLVAYYSAQGHTQAVAEAISQELGADIFVIEPAVPYTEDDLNWSDGSSRVSIEHDDPDLRSNQLVATAPAAFADYDTVFVGYPIWWGSASWAMTGFGGGNDFTNETVIPFCTSQSSPIGASGTELAELAGTGDWQEGRRFSQDATAAEVTEWVMSLAL